MAIRKIITRAIDSTASSADLNFDAGTLYVDTTNNRVGVKTSSPAYPMDIQVGGTSNYSTQSLLQLKSMTDANGNAVEMLFTPIITGQTRTAIGGARNLVSNNADLYFTTANTERMRIDANGNVRVGDNFNASGTKSLIVSSGAGHPAGVGRSLSALVVGQTDVSSFGLMGELKFTNGYDDPSNSFGGISAYYTNYTPATGVGGDLSLWTKVYSSAYPAEVMRLTSTGKVGIGDSAPSFKFVVTDSSFSTFNDSNVVAQLVSNKHTMLKLTTTGTGNNSWSVFADGSGGHLAFYDYSTAKQPVTIAKTTGSLMLTGNGASTTENMILRGPYASTYGWKVRTSDRGGGIDLDFIGTDGSDVDNGGLQLSITNSNRTMRWRGNNVSHAGDIVTATNNVSKTLVANEWVAIATLEGWDGLVLVLVEWSGLESSGTRVWDGKAAGVVACNSSNIYNAAPEEILYMNQSFHHRNVASFQFKLDSDNTLGAYGNQTLYIRNTEQGGSLNNIHVKVRQMI